MVNILSSTTGRNRPQKNTLNLWIRLGFGCTAANSFSDNLLKAVFTEAISNYLDEVEQLEENVGRDASVAEAQCIIQP